MTLLALVASATHGQPEPELDGPVSAQSGFGPGQIELEALLGMRDALISARDFTAALQPAQAVVAAFAEDDPALAPQLLPLARVQIELGSLDTAESTLFRVIDLISGAEASQVRELIQAYALLSDVHVAAERPAEAMAVLEQAREISRRNLGLFNLEQLPLMDRQTAVHLSIGETREAQRLQEQKLETAQRHFGSDAAALIPYRDALAQYYSRARLRGLAREQYLSILETQQASLGPNDPALLPALRRLLENDLVTGEDSGARTHIAQILAAAPTAVEPMERARSLAALGDWEAASSSIAAGLRYYQQSYDALAEDSRDAADAFFAEPVMIDFIPPLSPVDRGLRRRSYAWGTITLGFKLDADGRITDIEALSADPSGIMEQAYAERLGQTHFRPRFRAGRPAPTEGARLTHQFRYYVEEEP